MRPEAADFINAEPSEVGSGYSVYVYTPEGSKLLIASNLGESTAGRIATGVQEALRQWDGFR